MVSLFSRGYRLVTGRHRSQKAVSNAHAAVRRACCNVESLESRQLLAATYYVSAVGSDSNSGTSLALAWKSINRVNAAGLHAGDAVLFRSGDTFSGNLLLGAGEGGTSSAPIKLTTTGNGRATIKSSGYGLEVNGGGGILLKNINFSGPGASGNSKAGIYFHSSGSTRASNIEITGVDVGNYGDWGITLQGQGTNSGYSNVKIVNASVHDSGRGGIFLNAKKHNGNSNVYIGWCKTYNNAGISNSTAVTGHGIFVADTDGVTIERSVAANNGSKGVAPVGIWVSGCNKAVIQYNESYGNKSRSGTDGGGFDLDVDVSNSVMQYNYSHDNYGPGYAMAQTGTSTYYGHNIIRYNISQNDGRRNGRGAIHLWGKIQDAQIYNNTIYMTPAGSSDSAAIRAHNVGAGSNSTPKNVSVRNNIFYTTGGVKLTNITSAVAGAFSFQGNDYYSGGSTFNLNFAGKNYTSLGSFQSATGQEKGTGLSVNPQLNAPGGGGSLGDAGKLSSLSAYKLKSTSPVINKGLSPASGATLAAATKDFFGDSVPRGGKYDLGIDEV